MLGYTEFLSMINFKICGLDPYVVGNYAREHTGNLAKLLEVEEDKIFFSAESTMFFHYGIDQTSWHVLVDVQLPHDRHELIENVADYITKTINLYAINVHVLFSFYEPHHLFTKINSEYPLFIKDDNLVKTETEEVSEEDLTDEDKVFTGNIFKDFSKK